MSSYQLKQKQLLMEVEARARRGEILPAAPAPAVGYADDNRICLTSVVFLESELAETIVRQVIDPLRSADPCQYYYPPQSLHLTIQNVRIISDPPNFSAVDIENVRTIFTRVVPRHKAFNFEVQGLLELPASLSLCAYSSDALYFLVTELRSELARAGIADDKAYGSTEVFFGNVTVARYNAQPSAEFMAQVEKLKNLGVGTIPVTAITLITTNLVCYPAKTTRIATYHLALS